MMLLAAPNAKLHSERLKAHGSGRPYSEHHDPFSSQFLKRKTCVPENPQMPPQKACNQGF